ncbi:hypothetical protein NIES37_14080 [Tolypothrix tenuis PCC 7101]|uniref:Uncharacterized protein n=1 Tax=Tolypothrix tenuis PCC 7101 TaxID=231146 RepID=A0A1Z4MVF7_9CYAN|nr:hypothetical protein [Aulosira sp. FACHB-113]BAY97466.1 hypothetical protein NIES37_14080 [Tolypothrix tenuis PCC 7101]BAZ72025.1 hypothetical protein NIES50_05740 [Aulosira laxa NIES-50]
MDRKNFTIAGAAILALAIAGCTTEETPQATNPSPVAKPAVKSPPATQTFNNPLVPGKQVSKVAAATYSPASTLIQPTNATERLVLVSKGRTDPFAEIIAQGGNSILPNGQGRPVPNLPPLPIPKPPAVTVPVTTAPRSAVKAATIQPRKIQIQKTAAIPKLIPVLPKVLPPVLPSPNLVSVLPKPPEPDLAKSVFVTGVVLIGKQLQAIIKVPNEPSSRYVQAGQRLANGILIKRIEMNEGSNPIVIVEQYGIEVARMVGDAPTNSATPTTNPGGNPGSQTTPS